MVDAKIDFHDIYADGNRDVLDDCRIRVNGIFRKGLAVPIIVYYRAFSNGSSSADVADAAYRAW